MQRPSYQTKVAILSYHSWEISPETLVQDITSLREEGWQDLSLAEFYDFISKQRKFAGKFFLVTSDDGSEKDEAFVDALIEVNCPAVLFVNIGNIPNERLPFYRRLVNNGGVAVQDHGLYHRKQFVSAYVYDYVTPESYLGGLEYLELQPGMPLFASGSEITTRRFEPDPDAMAFAADTYSYLPPNATTEERRKAVEIALIGKGFGYRRLGRFYLRGKFETKEEFYKRVSEYLANGQQVFREKLGRKPKYFAYPWWQGSGEVDAILQTLGYIASFSEQGFLIKQDGKLFQIPRIPISSNTSRPISLEEYPIQYRRQGLFVAKGKRFIKTVLNVR